MNFVCLFVLIWIEWFIYWRRKKNIFDDMYVYTYVIYGLIFCTRSTRFSINVSVFSIDCIHLHICYCFDYLTDRQATNLSALFVQGNCEIVCLFAYLLKNGKKRIYLIFIVLLSILVKSNSVEIPKVREKTSAYLVIFYWLWIKSVNKHFFLVFLFSFDFQFTTK